MSTSSSQSVYFENQAARIVEDSRGFARLIWLPGSQHSPAVRAVFERLLRLLMRTGWGRVLADQQQLVPFSRPDVEWLLTDWFPRATEGGHYRWGAILTAADVFARLATTAMVGQARSMHRMHYQYFSEEAAAVTWLLAQGQ